MRNHGLEVRAGVIAERQAGGGERSQQGR
jgi:hypothetical protein